MITIQSGTDPNHHAWVMYGYIYRLILEPNMLELDVVAIQSDITVESPASV